VDEWLSNARNRLAGATDVDELLELARIAAHESGERINAPLLCYLVGLAQGRRGGDLAELVDAVVGKPA
jgi:hypothetical protein